MKLLQAVLVGVGPFEKLVLPFADEAGEARAMTVIHGAGGVGKSSVLAALASTRPGHCVVQPTRWEPPRVGSAAVRRLRLGARARRARCARTRFPWSAPTRV